MDILDTSVQYVKGVGPHKALAFKRIGVNTVNDLLRYLPRMHVHKDLLNKIMFANGGETVLIKGEVKSVEERRKPGRNILKVIVADASAELVWIWFNRPYLAREFKVGTKFIIKDTVENTKWGKQIIGTNGSYELLSEEDNKIIESGGILPVYHSTKVLKQDVLREILSSAISKYYMYLEDILPTEILYKYGLIKYRDAIRLIHIPSNLNELETAKKRLILEELFILQVYLLLRKEILAKKIKNRKYITSGRLIQEFQGKIPFSLTSAQKRVMSEIADDLNKDAPMNRLLQGDVGSGKTIVAINSLLIAVDSGYQGVVLVPTEILVEQHYFNFRNILKGLDVNIEMLISSLKGSRKKGIIEKLKSGKIDIIIGTHALLEENVEFQNLGLMIIDERHKFGVLQRAALENKGIYPDSLMMTATPFPRALVLTLYGDTDISVIDEMPPGRSPVTTKWIYENRRDEVYEFIRISVKDGGQVYMVYPAIETGPSNLKAATKMAEHLGRDIFPDFRVGLIHGRLKAEEKDRIMKDFKNGKIDILISTTVIEVGIDVSNASCIIIEHAERFGLAQLHQLRGRVGRGKRKATCILMTSWNLSWDAKERIKIMQKTNNGFEISEMDLKLRGPGELFGTRQHGISDLNLIDIARDVDLLEIARKEAAGILKNDPNLELQTHIGLKNYLKNKSGFSELEFATIS